MVATVLVMTDFENLKERFQRTGVGLMIEKIGKDTLHVTGKYLKAQLIILSIVCCICVAGLFFAGNRYALLAGLGIGICDALPFLGTGTIFIPWLILCLFEGKYLFAVLYGAIYVISTLAREFLEPKLVGKGAGAHPLAVIFSIYVGIYAYGTVGVILGPLSALLICEIYKMCVSNN
jgi:predicted PurR-regulated permease PerM